MNVLLGNLARGERRVQQARVSAGGPMREHTRFRRRVELVSAIELLVDVECNCMVHCWRTPRHFSSGQAPG